MAGLLLGVRLLLCGGFLSSSATTMFLASSKAILFKMSFLSAATHKVFSWAFTFVTMFFVNTIVTAMWWHDYLVEPPLVCGDGHGGLLAGVEDPLGPLGRLTCDGQCDGLVQGHALLSEEVLL